MSEDTYFDYIVSEIPRILSGYDPVFAAAGFTLLRGFALIAIFWAGVQVLFGTMPAGKLVSLFTMIAITALLVTYYTAPLPFANVGFRQLITDQAAAMSQQINSVQANEIHSQFTLVETRLTPPSWYDVLGVIQYLLVVIVLIIARALTLFAVSYGFLASATVGVFGPFFIPFLLFPGMDWMFWGWLKSFIQYSFYQVVASAYTLIMSQILITFCNRHLKDGTSLSSVFIPLLVVFVIYIYGIVKIPSLVSSLFSGRSGEGVTLGIR